MLHGQASKRQEQTTRNVDLMETLPMAATFAFLFSVRYRSSRDIIEGGQDDVKKGRKKKKKYRREDLTTMITLLL
jgi:alpha/beta superfamily hydrolase